MSGFTAKYAIPTLAASDPVGNAPTVMAALANRVDLLLGEAGQLSLTLVANTTLSVPITLARTYPGNNGAAVPGTVIWIMRATLSQPNTINTWVNTWLGSATTITGFTLNFQAPNAQAARLIDWRFLPVL